ncbi:MAG: WD40 repeat domain-containing protein [Opitutaceae bacterium]|nr:WD40 repeat domain-containing protein [Opitutaceae bacterium]
MKTPSFCPLRRLLLSLLLACVPLGANAQTLLVSNAGDESIGRLTLDLTIIDLYAFTNVGGGWPVPVSNPTAFAISGNDLFVSNPDHGVSRFNLTTGYVIDSNYIDGREHRSFALSGNDFFVGLTNGWIGRFNVADGLPIKEDFITGVGAPAAMAISGNDLFLANDLDGTISRYNLTTGQVISTDFITGLDNPISLAISGNDLFVANSGTGGENGFVGRYNLTTGEAIDATFVTGVSDLLSLAAYGTYLYVGMQNGINRYDITTGDLTHSISPAPGYVGAMVIEPAAIPEPSTYAALLGALVLGLAWRKRRGAV